MIRVPKNAPPIKTRVRKIPSCIDPSADFRRFGRELANQLTVINLSCERIRNALPTGAAQSIAEELERIAKSVEESVQTLEQIAQRDPAPPSRVRIPRGGAAAPAATSTGKVFPLFELLEKSG